MKRIHNFALISLALAVIRFIFMRSKNFKLFIEFLFEMVMKCSNTLLKYIKLNQLG
jgi:hypothetical protein